MRASRIVCSLVVLTLAVASVASADTKGSLVGRIVDERGKGIAGARVVANGAEDAEATTDEKGEFRLELAAGEYRLRFEADGYASSAFVDRVKIVSGKETKLPRKVELPESDQQSVIRGSVFDEVGRSVAGAKVVLERVPGDDGAPVRSMKRETRADSTGMFAFRVPEGEARYRLTATADKRAPATATVDVFGGEIVNAPPLKLASGKGE
jgi:hypothetical protein